MENMMMTEAEVALATEPLIQQICQVLEKAAPNPGIAVLALKILTQRISSTCGVSVKVITENLPMM